MSKPGARSFNIADVPEFQPGPEPAPVPTARAARGAQRMGIAVLPFDAPGKEQDTQGLANGLRLAGLEID